MSDEQTILRTGDKLWLSIGSLVLLGYLVVRAASQHVSFDESWHIYYATISDPWKLVKEIGRDMHPPTCSILLRPFVAIGPDPLWPRLLSIVPSALQPLLWFWLLRRIGISRPFAWASTIVLCTSHVFLDFAMIVRGYTLAHTVLMLACLAIAKAILSANSRRRIGVLACVAVGGAFWTEYSAAFAIAALAGGVIVTGMLDRDFGRTVTEAVRRTRWPERAFLLLAVLGIAAFYVASFGLRALPHGNEWFPVEGQSAADFVARGLVLDTYYFTPFDLRDVSWGALVITAALGMTFGVGLRLAGRPQLSREARLQGSVLLALIGLVVGMALLGVLHKYPWGGFVRHQLILVPFLHAALVIVLQELTPNVPRVRAIVASVLVAGAVLVGWRSHATFDTNEVQHAPLWQSAIDEAFAEDSTIPVCVPNCTFFGTAGTRLDTLDVEFEREIGEWDLYAAGSPRRAMLRPRFVWTIDPVPSEELLTALRAKCDELGFDAIWLMTMRFGGSPIEDRVALAAELERRCESAGFAVSR
ncbi:MAG: glycosyltransferase family 39 protein, partial [Planctomycetes bacterium]|nr:glycosyltransferase family 39 protein [Planctomycetota bacterium]